MRTLWKLSGLPKASADRKRRRLCFRMLNCIAAGAIGLILWLIVRLFALDSPDWLVCFVGFPVMLHGVLGSTIWLMHADDESEE